MAPGGLFDGVVVLVLFLCSAALTRVMIGVGIPDLPTARSSHDRPVPKGGGLAVAVTFGAGVVARYLWDDDPGFGPTAFAALLLLSVFVLAFAFYDDLRTLPVTGKLACQIVAALLFSLFVAKLEFVTLPGVGTVALGPWGHALTVFWLVAFMNVFNFMDGINGLAGGGAVVAGVFLGFVAQLSGAPFVYLSSLCLTGAILGFLVFNFPAGRIFLGDTGSQFIAFLLAGLAVIGATAQANKISIFVVPMLFFPFLYDVAVTLLRRLGLGRDVFAAHREHHYQLLNRLGVSQRGVSGLYVVLGLLHGVAAMTLQFADPPTRIFWFVAAAPVYALFTIVLYRASSRAGHSEDRSPPA
ncbi:MAG: glycosyltransferase family 4 protein [Alphaproteobacteria bacterium]